MVSSSSSSINKANYLSMNLTSQKTFQLVHKILKGNENDMTVLKEMVMDFDNLAHNGFNLKPEIKQH